MHLSNRLFLTLYPTTLENYLILQFHILNIHLNQVIDF